MSDAISLEELEQRVGQQLGSSEWITVDQSMIDQFADVTRDHQFIHVDPQRASTETDYGGTIAHGFLTLSLLSYLAVQVRPALENTAMGINYGFDKIRFLNAVVCGARVRGEFTLARVERRSDSQVLCHYSVVVAIENVTKPALVADWLVLTQLAS